MPYSGPGDASLPDYVKKMPKNKKAQWVHVFNSAFAGCMKKKGDKKACETFAFKNANGVVKDSLVHALVTPIFDALFRRNKEDRSISIPQVYDNVRATLQKAIQATDTWEWLLDVYYDDGALFAISTSGGKLYRREISITSEDNVEVGDPIQVKAEFPTVSQSRIMTQRQKDGSTRWFLLTGTTVINRNGSIDSSKLFDNMIARCEKSKEYPYLDFFHLRNAFRLGSTDWLARDGAVSLASGIMDDTPEGRAMIKAWAKDPDYWGASNSFYPIGGATMMEIADGIQIPVYEDGVYHSIGILPETEACSLFTAMQVSDRAKETINMEERVLEALRKLADGDEDLLNGWIKKVDETNETIVQENMVRRETEGTEEAPTESPVPELETPAAPPAQPETREVIIDDAVIEQISARVSENTIAPAVAKLTALIEGLSTNVVTLQKQIGDMQTAALKVNSRIADLEKDDEVKREAWAKDLPRSETRTRVTYRPSAPAKPEQGSEEKNMEDIANATLANIH